MLLMPLMRSTPLFRMAARIVRCESQRRCKAGSGRVRHPPNRSSLKASPYTEVIDGAIRYAETTAPLA